MRLHSLAAGAAMLALAAAAPQACSTSGPPGAPKPHGVQVSCQVNGPQLKWASPSAAVTFTNYTKRYLTVTHVTVDVVSTVFTTTFSTNSNVGIAPGKSGVVNVPQNRKFPGGCAVSTYRRYFTRAPHTGPGAGVPAAGSVGNAAG